MPQTLLSRPRARLAMAGLAVAALAAGCGSSSGGNGNADPASVVPGSAPVYASVLIKPEGDQKAQLEAALKKVLKTNDPGAKVEQLFNSATKKDGVNYKDDVKPWIGNRVGVFFTALSQNNSGTQGAVVIPTSDKGAALDSVRKGDKGVKKRSYRDVDYQVNDSNDASAAVGDFVVTGSEAGVKAVIDTSKDSGKAISQDEDFKKATAAAGGSDKLATLYLDLGGLIDSLVRSGAVDRQTALAIRQALTSTAAGEVAASASATADNFTLDFAALGSGRATAGGGDGPAALAGVPGDSWLGIGIGDLSGDINKALGQLGQLSALGGANIDQVFAQLKQQSGLDIRKDIIDWMGDAAIFVRGTSLSDIGGGLIIKSKDPQATATGIKRIAKLLRRQGQTVKAVSGVSGVDTGIQLEISRLPVYIVVAGDKFIAAVGKSSLDAALNDDASKSLGESPGFQKAASQLGSGIKPAVFFAMSPLLQVLESAGVGSQASYQQAKPYLEAFSTVVAGGKQTGDVGKGRIVISIR